MKSLTLLLCLTVPIGTRAQTPAPDPEPAFHAAGAFFALSVADLDASTQWYREKLGLRVTMSAPKSGGTAFAVLEGGGLIVELVERDDAVSPSSAAPAATERARVHGLFKAGMVVEDFDRTVAALRARGVEIAFGPYPAHDHQRANVIVRDNAGNLIQVFGP
jgi:catechol 2,3-dioxygenase-like lactoylglutathione lyase family enzyme